MSRPRHRSFGIQSRMLYPVAAVLLALAIPIAAQSRPIAPAFSSLEEMRGHYRPVLIFAPPGDPRLAQQAQSSAAHREELIDRQIMLVPFYQKYAGPVDAEIVTFLSFEESSIRRRFHIAPTDFTVILVGKDGGEKLRSHALVTMQQLIELIDAMPMRQQEMKLHHPE